MRLYGPSETRGTNAMIGCGTCGMIFSNGTNSESGTPRPNEAPIKPTEMGQAPTTDHSLYSGSYGPIGRGNGSCPASFPTGLSFSLSTAIGLSLIHRPPKRVS